MRSYILATVAAVLYVVPNAAVAQRIDTPLGEFRVGPGYHGRSAYRGECRELRKACLNKEELGEQGMGNCRRYRQICQGR